MAITTNGISTGRSTETGIAKPISVDGKSPAGGAPEADGVGDDYNVQISNKAMSVKDDHKKAFDIAKATSAVREDKVQLYKDKIKAGEYKADPGKIADGMLREAIKDHLSRGE